MYYAFIKENKILCCGQCKCLDEGVYNAEITKELFDDLILTPDKYIVGEKEIEIIDYDEEGNPIGSHLETVPYPVIDPDYEEKQAEKREAEFHKEFFNTSLGYIRRSVTMADGTHKDFLSDLLPVISMAVTMKQAVTILAYDEPDFSQDVEDWTQYQHQETVTAQFIQECFAQLQNDFIPANEE